MKYQMRGIAMLLFGILLSVASIPVANSDAFGLLWIAGIAIGVFGLILTFVTE